MAREREESEATALIEGDLEIKILYGNYSSEMRSVGVEPNPKDFLESATYKVFESFRKAGVPYPLLDRIFQALDAEKLDTKEEKKAFLDKYLPNMTQEELIKMGVDYSGSHTEKALKNLTAVTFEAPVITPEEKTRIQASEGDTLGRGLKAQYEKGKENKEKAAAPNAPGFLERVKIAIQAASKNIQDAAQRATAKIDQRVAAAAEKREIKQAVKEGQGKPSLLERIKTAATDAKIKISGIANKAIEKLQAIGKKAESENIAISASENFEHREGNSKPVTDNTAQLAAQAALNTQQGNNAEEVQAPPPREVEKSQEEVAEDDLELSKEDREWLDNADEDQFDAEDAQARAEMDAARVTPEMAQDLADIEALQGITLEAIEVTEQTFTEKVEETVKHDVKAQQSASAAPVEEERDISAEIDAALSGIKFDNVGSNKPNTPTPDPGTPRNSGPGK